MAFTQQTNRRMLRLGTLVLFIASAVLLWRGFCDPALPETSLNDIEVATPRSLADVKPTRELSDFASVLGRSLRAPLYDKQPEPIEPESLVEEVELEPYDDESTLPEILAPREDVGLRLVGSMLSLIHI